MHAGFRCSGIADFRNPRVDKPYIPAAASGRPVGNTASVLLIASPPGALKYIKLRFHSQFTPYRDPASTAVAVLAWNLLDSAGTRTLPSFLEAILRESAARILQVVPVEAGEGGTDRSRDCD